MPKLKVTKKPELRKPINKNVQDWILSRLRFKQCPCTLRSELPTEKDKADEETNDAVYSQTTGTRRSSRKRVQKATKKQMEKEERERLIKGTSDIAVKAIGITDGEPWTYERKVAHIKSGQCKLQQRAPKLRCPFDCQINQHHVDTDEKKEKEEEEVKETKASAKKKGKAQKKGSK